MKCSVFLNRDTDALARARTYTLIRVRAHARTMAALGDHEASWGLKDCALARNTSTSCQVMHYAGAFLVTNTSTLDFSFTRPHAVRCEWRASGVHCTADKPWIRDVRLVCAAEATLASQCVVHFDTQQALVEILLCVLFITALIGASALLEVIRWSRSDDSSTRHKIN